MSDDIPIRNLYYAGDVAGQMKLLDDIPNLDAFIDNGKLVLKDRGIGVRDIEILIDVRNEMIGIPSLSDVGVNVTILIRPNVRVGQIIRIESVIYPAANGRYTIVNLGIDVANREQPFYYNIFATRLTNG